MGVGLIDEHEKTGLSSFLRRREAKSACVQLFADIDKKFDLKRGDITLSQNPTYQQIVESLDAALTNDWISNADMCSFLDRLEAAGRQHVLLFRVPDRKVTELNTALANPAHTEFDSSLATYWEPPEASFARVLVADSHGTAVKIVTKRKYFVQSEPVTKGTKQFIERDERWERSAIILKFTKRLRLLQLRVPVLENSADDNPKVLLDISKLIFSTHFNEGLFGLLQLFPITDAFHPILQNKSDFTLTREHRDDGEYYGTEGRRRPIEGAPLDLRQSPDWKNDGKPRLRVDGSWKIRDDRHLDCRMHFEKVRLAPRSFKDLARLFIPQSCTDQEMDHVIQRIHDHVQQSN